jgi:hypothetical protein
MNTREDDLINLERWKAGTEASHGLYTQEFTRLSVSSVPEFQIKRNPLV